MIRKLSLVEWCVVGSIFLMCLILLIPSPKWGSSGTISCPVHVFVFNAKDGTPIEAAQVDIIRIPLSIDPIYSPDYAENFSGLIRLIEKNGFSHTTHADGIAVIDQEFNTTASYKHAETSASTYLYSVLISTSNYGSVVTPLRYQPTPVHQMKAVEKSFPELVSGQHNHHSFKQNDLWSLQQDVPPINLRVPFQGLDLGLKSL